MQVVLTKYARDLDLFDRFPHALPLAAATGYTKTSTGVSAGNFKLQSEHKERAKMPANRTTDHYSVAAPGIPVDARAPQKENQCQES
jgi:hypothetical protein